MERGISSGPALLAKTNIKDLQKNRNAICLEILSLDPSIFRMGHPDLLVQTLCKIYGPVDTKVSHLKF